MQIKAKQIFLVGAFIVLTIIGYRLLKRDEIVITSDTFEQKNSENSGEKEETIFVHIEGAVNSPGIKEVTKGTRIFELIELADGETSDADISKINLASILKDEQKVVIPYIKTLDETTSSATQNLVATANEEIMVNINNANLEELQKLEGIGPSMAQKILKYREEVGYFSSIEDIKNVSGIGESKYNKIKENITI